jgi:hypothetical protein
VFRPDRLVPALFAGILCCLVALLVKEEGPAALSQPGRYLVTGPEEGAGSLVRIDSLTGDSWRLILGESEAYWEPFGAAEPIVEAAARRGALVARAPTAIRDPEPEDGSVGDHSPAVIAELGGALLNQELPSEMRVWAAYQLAEAPGDVATGALIQVLDDPEPRVVRAALEALASHSGSRVKAVLEGMRAHPDPFVSRRVGELLLERSAAAS